MVEIASPTPPVQQPVPNAPAPSGSPLKWVAILFVLILLLSGATVFLFQKKEPKKNAAEMQDEKSANESQKTPEKVVCKRFTSLDEALNNIEIACVLDLSGQSLTEVPQGVYKLTKINEIDLSDNKLTRFPTDLLKLEGLISLDLSNNQISSIPEGSTVRPTVQPNPSGTPVSLPNQLQNLQLDGNPMSAEAIKRYEINPK